MPQAANAKTITRNIQLLALETVLYPVDPINAMNAPISITIISQVMLFGVVSVSFVISISKGISTAVADNVTTAQNKKQNKIPSARL